MAEDSAEPETPETPLADSVLRARQAVKTRREAEDTARRVAEDVVGRAIKDLVSPRTFDRLVMESLKRMRRNY